MVRRNRARRAPSPLDQTTRATTCRWELQAREAHDIGKMHEKGYATSTDPELLPWTPATCSTECPSHVALRRRRPEQQHCRRSFAIKPAPRTTTST